MMKVLSVRPAFVEAILAGTKTEEYRSWQTTHRGLLLLHATRPVGAILGCVQVTDCLDAGVYEGGFAWQLERPVRFATPLECKGRLGLWDLPAELEAEVRRLHALALVR